MFFIASDHAGFELKKSMIQKLTEEQILFVDLGTDSEESCDYPDFAEKLCMALLKSEASDSLGLLICGTGVGMSIAANKIKGIRAACVSEEKSAEMARAHNQAQVLCLGSRIIDFEKAWSCVKVFRAAVFDASHPRHQRRLEKIQSLESKK